MDADFLDMMSSTVKVAPVAAHDGYGKRTFGTDVSYLAHEELSTIETRDTKGNTVVGNGRVFLYTGPGVAFPSIQPDDRLTLSDGSVQPVLNVERWTDEDGAYAMVILF